MTKYRIQFLVIVGMILLYIVLKYFNVIGWYKIPTPSMEPNYEVGQLIFSSNLKSYTHNSVVGYKDTIPESKGYRIGGPGQFIGRIVAMEGDQFELKDGFVYINGKHQEENLNLKFQYMIPPKLVKENTAFLKEMDRTRKIPSRDGGQLVTLDKEELNNFSGKEVLVKNDFKLYQRLKNPFKLEEKEVMHWTLLNLGPIQIPNGHVFILGDNRNNSDDSRIRGCIPENDIFATVVN